MLDLYFQIRAGLFITWINTVKLFVVVEHLKSCISWVGHSTNLRSQQNLSLIKYFLIFLENPPIHVSTNMCFVVQGQNFMPMENDCTAIDVIQMLDLYFFVD